MTQLTRDKAKRWAFSGITLGTTVVHRLGLTRLNLLRRSNRKGRRLEIGPGRRRIEGFETLNVVGWLNVDFVCDATRRLPFPDGTFELVYASHILEHVPWYQTVDVLREWVRILEPGGALELWVPDGLKVARAWVEAEAEGSRAFEQDGWFKFNPERDPCVWANGRIFSYGDGTGRKENPNWHLAMFSERRLRQVMQQAGLVDLERMTAPDDVRGSDHGWINLGIRGFRRDG